MSHPGGGHGYRLFSLKLSVILMFVFPIIAFFLLIIISLGIKRFLVTNVFLYQFLFKPYRRYRIAPGPKLLSIEIPLPSSKLTGYRYRTFSLYVPEHLCHGILRRYLHQHVHMIHHLVSFHYFTTSLPSQIVKHRTKKFSYFTIQSFLRPLGTKTT